MENTVKLTKKEYFANIISALRGDETEVAVDTLVEFCETEIALLEKRAAKAKATAAAKKSEGDALTDAVFGVLSEEPMTLADSVQALEDETVTPAKVTYRLGQLFNAEKITKEEITIKVEGAKPRKLMTYKLA